MYQQKCFEKKHVDLLLIKKKVKGTMFLSKILIHLYMIFGKNIFAVVAYKLLGQNNITMSH